MQFSIPSADLASAIGLVKGVVPTRATIPILNNICVKATDDGYIELTASCIDMQATSRERCEVVSPGEITIPGHAFFGLAKSLPKTKIVTVDIGGDRASIVCGKSSYNLATLPAPDFPIMSSDDDGGIAISMPAADLAAAFTATIPTTSTLDDRIYMQGVHIRPDDGNLAFVSSDGHRFVRYSIAIDGSESIPHTIIPAEACRAIAGMCAETDGNVELIFTPTRITASCAIAVITSKLIAATFPDYTSLIPRAASAFSADASEFASAVDRLALTYSGVDTKQPLCVVNAGNGVEIRSSRKSANKGREIIDATVSHPTLFGVNVKYLADAVKSFVGASTVAVQSAGGMSPIIITAEDAPCKLFLIMPMNMAGEGVAETHESEAA